MIVKIINRFNNKIQPLTISIYVNLWYTTSNANQYSGNSLFMNFFLANAIQNLFIFVPSSTYKWSTRRKPISSRHCARYDFNVSPSWNVFGPSMIPPNPVVMSKWSCANAKRSFAPSVIRFFLLLLLPCEEDDDAWFWFWWSLFKHWEM